MAGSGQHIILKERDRIGDRALFVSGNALSNGARIDNALTPPANRVKGAPEGNILMRGLLMAYLSFGLFGSEAPASARHGHARAPITKTSAKTTTTKTV